MNGYPFTCPIELRFADVDAMNHVNNAVIVSYLETARLKLWQAHFEFTGPARSIPMIVARIVVDYRSPISLEEPVEIGVGVSSIGRTSFSFRYRIEAAGRLAAEAESVQVHYDYGRRRPIAIDDTLQARLAALQLRAPA